jgi:hypothetical protein
MSSALDAIVASADREPADLPRLPAAQVFLHHSRIGTALSQAADAYKSIPDATPARCTEHLKEIIKACHVAATAAERLIESNK